MKDSDIKAVKALTFIDGKFSCIYVPCTGARIGCMEAEDGYHRKYSEVRCFGGLPNGEPCDSCPYHTEIMMLCFNYNEKDGKKK